MMPQTLKKTKQICLLLFCCNVFTFKLEALTICGSFLSRSQSKSVIVKSLVSSPAWMRCSFPEKLFSINVNYEMEAVIQIHQAYVTL